MCMKNINVVADFYESDLSTFSGPMKFGEVLECVKAKKGPDGKRYIDQLTVATLICAMSSSEDPDLLKKYKVRWTFGRVKTDSDGKDSFEYYVVSDAEFNPMKNKKEKISQAICRHFSNQTFKFTLRDYEVSEAGDYYLKVFLKGESETTWTLQSMNYINVEF